MKIKKCPVCGAKNTEVCIGGIDASYYARCREAECALCGPFRDTPEGAIKIWNRLELRKAK